MGPVSGFTLHHFGGQLDIGQRGAELMGHMIKKLAVFFTDFLLFDQVISGKYKQGTDRK